MLAFAVVVIGGLGSLGGAALGALLVGLVRAATVRYWPEAELFSILRRDGDRADRASRRACSPHRRRARYEGRRSQP